jgi:hypothetical protein
MDEYNKNPAKRHTHNCYAFAIGYTDPNKIVQCESNEECRSGFHVPGKKSGHPSFKGNLGKRCSDIVARTMADIPEATLSDFSSSCPAKMSKIALVADENNDFHYYAQSSSGNFMHKPGGRSATNVDAEGSLIYRPDLASRYYPPEFDGDNGLNYDSFCSYMCVPRNHPNVVYGGSKKKTLKRSRARARAKAKAKSRKQF